MVSADAVDASVVALAVQRGADIVTGDPEDVERLVSAAQTKVAVLNV